MRNPQKNAAREMERGFAFVPFLAWAGVSAIAGAGLYYFSPEILSGLGALFLELARILVIYSGQIFNFFINHVIVGFGTTLNTLGMTSGIETAWSAFRDLGNIVIIGLFVFICINLILGVKQFGTHRMVANVIIVAILINFSLLFSRGIIDASNFTAYQFYRATGLADVGTTAQNAAGNTQSAAAAVKSDGIAGAFLRVTGVTGFWDTYELLKNTAKAQGGVTALAYGIVAMLFLLCLVAVFLYGSFLIISRGILLVMLMVVSPVAFAAWLVPHSMISGKWSEWWEALLKAAFFAPLLMMFLWASLLILKSATGPSGVSFGQFLLDPNNPDGWRVIVVYFFAIGLLFLSLKFASKFSSSIAGFASVAGVLSRPLKFAGSIAGNQAANATGLISRTLLGGLATKLAQSRLGRALPTEGLVAGIPGRLALSALHGAASRNWDPRNLSSVKAASKNLGLDIGKAGGKGGFLKQGAETEKRIAEQKTKIAELMGHQSASERKAIGEHKEIIDASSTRHNEAKTARDAAQRTVTQTTREHSREHDAQIRREEELNRRQKERHKELIEAVTRANTSPDKVDPATGRHKDELQQAIRSINTSISEQTEKITNIRNSYQPRLEEKLGDLPNKISQLEAHMADETALQKETNRLLDATGPRQRQREYLEGLHKERYFSTFGNATSSKEIAKKVRDGLKKTPEQKENEKLRALMAKIVASEENPPAATPRPSEDTSH